MKTLNLIKTFSMSFYLIVLIGFTANAESMKLASNENNRLALISAFKKLKIFYIDTHTNFITIYLGANTQKIFKKLLSFGIILRPLDNYGLKNFLRVTIGTKYECKKFVKMLKIAMDQTS